MQSHPATLLVNATTHAQSLLHQFQEIIHAQDKELEKVHDQDQREIKIKNYKMGKHYITATRTQSYLPCPLDTYVHFINDHAQQKQLYSSIDQYDLLAEDIHGNNKHQLFYLKYKKVGLVSARDFVYYRCIQYMPDGQCFIISKSLPEIQQLIKQDKSVVRGDFMTSGTLLTQLSPERLQISTYNEIDMKIMMPFSLTKPMTLKEIHKSLDNLLQAILSYEYEPQPVHKQQCLLPVLTIEQILREIDQRVDAQSGDVLLFL